MGSAARGLLEMRSEAAEKSAAVGFLGVGTWSYTLLSLPPAFILPLPHPCGVLGSITWAPSGSSSGEGPGVEAELGWRSWYKGAARQRWVFPPLRSRRNRLLAHDKAAFDVKAPAPWSCKSAKMSRDRLLMCGVRENAEQ